jgi:hypothetical protein
MYITLKGKNDRTIESLGDFIRMKINNGSRFSVEIDILSARRLKMRNVRLKESRPYCGSHPNACEVAGADRSYKYLEGTDWVEFNDRINDCLDFLNINARVFSGVCEVRAGTKRRINYGSHHTGWFNQPYEWDKVGEPCDYEDYCGIYAPDSSYPFGTPGDYEERKPLYA